MYALYTASMLGVVWKYRIEEFRFQIIDRKQPELITKRVITSEAARVFDQQGYWTPVTIRAELFIQEL